MAALVMAAIFMGACGREVAASGNVTQGAAPGNAVKVVARDNDFVPAQIKGKAGEEIAVEVINNGDSPHNFVIKDLDLSSGTLESDKVATVTFVMPETPTEFVCTFHGGMKGELVPEEA
ncbi:MAG TPA: cupredoxin domain-containing protein [Actinomycetota bacterium]|nr:cupredoxin domain-containing protein [Actinomycetota bacterium]